MVAVGLVVDVAPFAVEVGTVVVVAGGGAGISKTIDDVEDLTVTTGPGALPVPPDAVAVVADVGELAEAEFEAVTVTVRVTGVPRGGLSGPSRLIA